MNSFYLLAAASGGLVEGLTQTAHGVGESFGFSKQLFFSQLIAFVIVAGLLAKFAFGPIVAMLEERKKRIAESMANADKIKADLANAEAKSRELVTQAGTQANKIIEETRAAAAKITEQETQKAVAAAAQIIAKAKESNEAELVRMKAELRKEVTRLVVETSAKVTGNILTAEQKQRLADDANQQLVNN